MDFGWLVGRRWLACAALCAAMTGSASALADAHELAPSPRAWPNPMATEPLVAHARQRASSELATSRARLKSPEAAAVRRRSRFAYADLGRSGAWALGRQRFPGFLGRDSGAPTTLPNGWRIKEPVSENVARIENAQGESAGLVVSSAPVAVEASGSLEVVSLALEETARGFRLKRPASDVRFPVRASGTVRLPNAGVSFALPGAKDVTSVPESHQLFFPDAIADDVDYALVPKAAGVEVLWQLRTAASPEELQLSFALPEGATFVPVPATRFGERPSGEIRMERADGTTIARVSPPAAFDADGTAVPVQTRVSGSTIVLTVEHHEQDVSYPILVDPVVQEIWSRPSPGRLGGFRNCGGDTDTGTNTNGGAWASGTAFPNNITFTCDMNAFSWGSGLYTVLKEMWHPSWTWGQWIWSAPADSYISSVWWDNARHGPGNNVPGNTFAFAGLWTGSNWASYYEWGHRSHSSLHQTGSATANLAAFGLRTNGDGRRGQGWTLPTGHSGVEGAAVTINDSHDPTVDLLHHTHMAAGDNKTSWIDPAQGGTWPKFRLRLGDRGLGLWKYGVQRTDTGQWMAGIGQMDCDGVWVSCRNSHDTPPVNYWDSAITEGVIPLRGFAWDINERLGGSPMFYLRIDQSNPSASIAERSSLNGQTLSAPSYDLNITATDGDPASLGTQRSGVTKVRVSLDNVTLSQWSWSCATSCARAVSYLLDATAIAAGAHTIKVEAWDAIGHRGEDSFTANFNYFGGRDATINEPEEASRLVTYLESLGIDAADDYWSRMSLPERRYVFSAAASTDPQQICREAYYDDLDGNWEFCRRNDLRWEDDDPVANASDEYDITEGEKAFCRAYFALCRKFYRDSAVATSMMEMTHSGYDGEVDGTKANAFKHSLWTALMTISGGQTTLGLNLAVAHEAHQYARATNTRRRRMSRMDIINNRVGYWVGESAGGSRHEARVNACRTLLARVRNGTLIDRELDPFAEYKRLGFGSSNFENSATELISELVWRRTTSRTGGTVGQHLSADSRCQEIE